ncbi:hypothetical protein N665_0008s0010 [Sinapis alba]|nr:hypothetical protein N665_0008s0010 [Sinapis alba]
MTERRDLSSSAGNGNSFSRSSPRIDDESISVSLRVWRRRVSLCLVSGVSLGRCHKDRSGFEGAWTSNPPIFDNSYFKELLSGEKESLLQLVSDKALLDDHVFRLLVEKYFAVC